MSESYTYTPHGVCSKRIDIEVEDHKITNLKFLGGCNGNLKAIGKLVNGHDIDEIADILEGNTCGFKPTSCADQLSKALRAISEKEAAEKDATPSES